MSKTYPEPDYAKQCSSYVLEVRAMLMRWFQALEEAERTGQPLPYLPDPLGVQVTEAQAQRIVDELQNALWEKERHWLENCGADRGGPYEAGPGFERLTFPQRVALIQEWSAIKRKYPGASKESDTAYVPV